MHQHMNDKPYSKANAEEILNSLDGMRRAEPQPYFYTRLMTKLDKQKNGWEKVAGFISKPVFAIAMIALFLIINIAILFNSSSNATSSSQEESSLAVENDYGLSVQSIYDINPDQSDIAQK